MGVLEIGQGLDEPDLGLELRKVEQGPQMLVHAV